MSVGYLGEIRMFGGDFAPRNWISCDGSLLAVNQYPDLFKLLGTRYGGDGARTFALPDLRGRIPIGVGHGSGLTARTLGQKVGEEQVTLTTDQFPAHMHDWMAVPLAATELSPNNAAVANAASEYYSNDDRKLVPMHADTVGNNGGQRPHSNMMPSLSIRFIMCMVGPVPQQG